MDYVISFFVATVVCWALIPILIRYAPQLGMLDVPGERKVHSVAIPRCGGVGIATGTIIAAALLLPFNTLYQQLIIGGLIIVLFGIADDVLEINYKWKFLGQFLAVCYVVSQGIVIKFVPFMGMNEAPWYFSYTLTVLFVIGVTNAVNLSDGLDGLAAGIILLSLACIAFFAFFSGGTHIDVMAFAVIGGIVGFLRFNTHPAIIFMGDTGSQFIGFMAAFLVIVLTQNVSTAFNPALPLLILGLPILDTISVMTQRIKAGKSPFSADKRHIHHKLLVCGFTHEEAVVIIYLLQAFFLIAAFILRYATDIEVIGVFLLISSVILWAFYVASIKQWKFHSDRVGQDRRNNYFRYHGWLFAFCRRYIEFSICIYLFFLLASLAFISSPIWQNEIIYLFLALCIYKWLPLNIQDFFIRVSIYSSVMFSCYIIFEFSGFHQIIFDLMDIFFLILFVVVTLAVKVTRKSYFRLTTQDALISLLMLSSLFFVNTGFIVSVLLYLFCLGYALEYLFHRDAYQFKFLRILAIFYMLNFSIFLAVYI
ncbi:MAG: undecaprenyl/decaprenyl-phosphate alpha-N-acetylglucosaminyl 1-phosphate transferase [Methylococcaceae bacterium]|nr:undecaprenyl/decaprenyl-phosphate alpha-N-acetylglucosaminyl 1-phosphate transferase [Methylococcaceae bacterium]